MPLYLFYYFFLCAIIVPFFLFFVFFFFEFVKNTFRFFGKRFYRVYFGGFLLTYCYYRYFYYWYKNGGVFIFLLFLGFFTLGDFFLFFDQLFFFSLFSEFSFSDLGLNKDFIGGFEASAVLSIRSLSSGIFYVASNGVVFIKLINNITLGYGFFIFTFLTFILFRLFFKVSFFFFLNLYISFWLYIFSFLLLFRYYNLSSLGTFFFEQDYVFAVNSFLFTFRFDSLSLLLINLTTFLIFISILATFNRVYPTKDFALESVLLLFIESLLILSFLTVDLVIFFLCFEAILIPMSIYLLVLGSDARKSLAFRYFFFFSFFGSLLMLFSVIYLFNFCGTTNINSVMLYSESYTLWVTLPLCIGLMVKVPMFPFYIWLPEAHVEAPTTGSMILAGILLKLGGYGFIRFLFPLIGYHLVFFQNLIFICAFLGVFYASCSILVLTDLKKIIAFSSIIHMNIGMMSLFTYTNVGLYGFVILMLAHGLVSAGLFFLVGIIYIRFGTRLIKDLRGLQTIMPIYIFFFYLFIFFNISFPGTLNFIGEFLLFTGLTYNFVFLSSITLFISYFFGGIYSVWLITRIAAGVFKPKVVLYSSLQDLNVIEFLILFMLVCYIIILGICPGSLFTFLSFDLQKLHYFL